MRRGGIIGTPNNSTPSSTKGVWNLHEQHLARKSRIWPGSIVQNQLALHLDSKNTDSYPGSGTVWYDMSPHKRHANFVNSPIFEPYEKVFHLTGANEYFQCSNFGLAASNADFTYGAWIQFDTIGNYNSIFEHGAYPTSVLFRFESTGFNIWAGSTNYGILTWSPTIHTWYYINFVRRGNTLYLYVNGVQTSSVAFGLNVSSLPNLSTSSFGIGVSNHASVTQLWCGKISQVQYYTRALSNTEILANYNAHVSRFTTSPINLIYAEGQNANLYTSYWSNTSWYYMANYGNLGPVNAHGYTALGTYTFSISSLPAHSQARYRIYWHFVDSLDGETSYQYATNNAGSEFLVARFTKVYNVDGISLVSQSAGSVIKNGLSRPYSYTPWYTAATTKPSPYYNSFAVIDTGWFDHTLSTFSARSVIGADQAQSDEAIYLSHVKMWIV